MAAFLVDESLPRAVKRALAAAGHDVVDARDVGLRGRHDRLVAERAAAEGRVLLCDDLDFSNALRFPPGSHPGIVVLRVPNTRGPAERSERVVTVVREIGIERLAGAIVIVEPARARILPPRAG